MKFGGQPAITCLNCLEFLNPKIAAICSVRSREPPEFRVETGRHARFQEIQTVFWVSRFGIVFDDGSMARNDLSALLRNLEPVAVKLGRYAYHLDKVSRTQEIFQKSFLFAGTAVG